MDRKVESKGDTFRLQYTPTHILEEFSSHQHNGEKLGICNIDAFPLLLLLFYSCWLQLAFVIKKRSDLEW